MFTIHVTCKNANKIRNVMYKGKFENKVARFLPWVTVDIDISMTKV